MSRLLSYIDQLFVPVNDEQEIVFIKVKDTYSKDIVFDGLPTELLTKIEKDA